MRLAPSSSRPPPRSKVQNRDRARLGADRERLPVRVHARARFVPGAVEERERDGQPSVASVPRGVFSVVGVVVIIGDDAVAGGDGHDHRTERSHVRDRRGVVVQHREARAAVGYLPQTHASVRGARDEPRKERRGRRRRGGRASTAAARPERRG
eukprot:30401-Pelagococcus_subviridis.AAC.3